MKHYTLEEVRQLWKEKAPWSEPLNEIAIFDNPERATIVFMYYEVGSDDDGPGADFNWLTPEELKSMGINGDEDTGIETLEYVGDTGLLINFSGDEIYNVNIIY